VPRLRRVRSQELSASELSALRTLFAEAWPSEHADGGFSDEDWTHAFGGLHLIVEDEGSIVSHASVVPRRLMTQGRSWRTGYVEAVSTRPHMQRHGFASMVMREATAFIDERYDLGALGTGLPTFYSRFGWVVWAGPTSAMPPDGGSGGAPARTPEEDGAVMVHLTARSTGIDTAAELTCDWRPGDVW
jgi:aminoglycoside 2'-N-acetyltransferase I